jgi:hypothetical protein
MASLEHWIHTGIEEITVNHVEVTILLWRVKMNQSTTAIPVFERWPLGSVPSYVMMNHPEHYSVNNDEFRVRTLVS